MADRQLRWFVPGRLSEFGDAPSEVQGVHVLDDDYEPGDTFLHQRLASTGRNLIIDINDDGVSIFDNQPALPSGLKQHVHSTVNRVAMRKGSVISLDIDQVSATAAGEDLTVILDIHKT